MLILNEQDIEQIGINWDSTIAIIEDSVRCLEHQDYAQPIKPYLRYRNPKNRIIAMPAFIGGDFNVAGIKWIASFPENIQKGIPRAHSVIILNRAETGEPFCVINTPLLSVIRTASVSGLLVKYYQEVRTLDKVKIGLTGFGPIGQYHLKMCAAILGDLIDRIRVFDIRPMDHTDFEDIPPIEMVSSWEEAYEDADIFITCTVSEAPYVNIPPKPGSLHLNVSLRDYQASMCKWFKGSIIVDDWEEVCRQETDIEKMHIEHGLRQEDTKSMIDVVAHNCLDSYPQDQAIMFNPMGMAVFDIGLGSYYHQLAETLKVHEQQNLFNSI